MDDESYTPTTKSKQERIRDNQRRSRARRQEYLADLERRLSECHITCREADLQKQAFGQLQLENTRLRELLAHAGISFDLVESYLAQDAFSLSIDPGSSLRQIKPKMGLTDSHKSSHTASDTTCSSAESGPSRSAYESPTGLARSHQPIPALAMPHLSTTPVELASPAYHSGYSPASARTSDSPQLIPYTPTGSGPSSAMHTGFEWPHGNVYPAATRSMHPHAEMAFPNDHVPINVGAVHAPLPQQPAPFPLTRDMVERPHIKGPGIEDMKHQLYTPVPPPGYNGPNFSIDSQVLFNVLSELSARHG